MRVRRSSGPTKAANGASLGERLRGRLARRTKILALAGICAHYGEVTFRNRGKTGLGYRSGVSFAALIW